MGRLARCKVYETDIKYIREGGVNMSEGVKTALQTAMTGVKTDVLGIVEIAVPAALAIVAVVMSIKMGVRFFKSIASA